MGRRLLVTYTVPPLVYYPPGYPLRDGTVNFCQNVAERGLKMYGRPDWQSRAGAILAAELCGRGYDALSRQGYLPPGAPQLRPGGPRQNYIDYDRQTLTDYPLPGPRRQPTPSYFPQPNVPLPKPQAPSPVPQPQPPLPGPRQPQVPVVAQPIPDFPGQPQIPRIAQPIPGPRSQPSGPTVSQTPTPGPKQPTLAIPIPEPQFPNPGAGQQPTVFIPQLPSRPKTKSGNYPGAPDSGSPVIVLPGPEGVIILPDIGYFINLIGSLFGQTPIKAQKQGLQTFFNPIFKEYASKLGLSLRDGHFLQFDPKGVQQYTLSNPLYAGLREQLLSRAGPLATYIHSNPGPGLTERLVNQFVTNAAINGWSIEQAANLFDGLTAAIPKAAVSVPFVYQGNDPNSPDPGPSVG